MPTSPQNDVPKTVGELPVVLDHIEKSKPSQVGDVNIAPTTTAAQDSRQQSQQAINYVWENTQRIIALSVTWAALVVAIYLALWANDVNVTLAACVFIFGVANLVIGFYFGRTNHTRTGGVSVGDIGR